MKARCHWCKARLTAERKRGASVAGGIFVVLTTLHEDATCRNKKESECTNSNGSNRGVGQVMAVSWNNRSRRV